MRGAGTKNKEGGEEEEKSEKKGEKSREKSKEEKSNPTPPNPLSPSHPHRQSQSPFQLSFPSAGASPSPTATRRWAADPATFIQQEARRVSARGVVEEVAVEDEQQTEDPRKEILWVQKDRRGKREKMFVERGYLADERDGVNVRDFAVLPFLQRRGGCVELG